MRLRRIAVLGLVLLVTGVSAAQGLGVPAGVPSIPSLPSLPAGVVTDPVGRTAAVASRRVPMEQLRRLQVRELLRTQRERIDVDARGEPVLRGEFLAIAPGDALLAAARAAGFEIARRSEGDALGLDIIVLRDTHGRAATRAMQVLERLAPAGTFAYQHVYLQAGTPADTTVPRMHGNRAALRVGLVDGGIDATHPALANAQVHRHGCDGRAIAHAHGTTVAARLISGSQGTLYAADLWCGDPVGRATLGLVDALGWFARERVAVVNVSLVGPHNPVLDRAVQALLARGHVVVAAVGNDGPAAPPLYPAAYPGVIGVSGVDAKLRALPEAASGMHVDFSAIGLAGEGARAARGTSFAAPVVARLAAGIVRVPEAGAATRVQRTLVARARDLGKPGRDPRYGDGFVAAP